MQLLVDPTILTPTTFDFNILVNVEINIRINTINLEVFIVVGNVNLW